MSKPKVSVTMATFNVEKFIEQSMDCIVSQTLKDIEIICIDDASVDSTADILESYANKDERITVVRKDKNEGLAVARHDALDLAKGDYIIFVDGDDLMDVDMIEKGYNAAINVDADMVLWDYQIFTSDKDLDYNCLSRIGSIDFSNKVNLLKRPSFTWVRLLNRERIIELGINFPRGLTRQDIPPHWLEVTRFDNIVVIPEKLSYYRQHQGATTSKRDRRLFDIITVMDIVKEQLLRDGLYRLYKDEFLRQRIGHLYGVYDAISDEYKDEAFELIKSKLGDEEWEYIYSKDNMLKWYAISFFKGINGSVINMLKYKSRLFSRSIYRLIK